VKRALVVTAILALVMAGPAGAATRLPRAERDAINRTLDQFVNSAVKRQNVDSAWNLVTPELRAGISRSSWDKGNLPVYPYPARGTTFHGWTVDFASPNEVDFQLMIGKSKTDSIQFTGTVKKLQGRWLVDSFNSAATFSGGGTVVGPHDFTAPSGGGGGKGVARLGSTWIAVPAAIIGGGVLLVLGFFAFVWLRNRWAYRRAQLRPLEPIVVRRRDSEPALVAKEGSEADG
jgi:hypothetical protein